MTDIIAGCPATHREWIMKPWVAHLQRAAQHADVGLSIYCLVPSKDAPTAIAVQEACLSRGIELFLEQADDDKPDDERSWNPLRYERMCVLRNTMLDTVRSLMPNLFLSIDSDILIGRDVISKLITCMQEREFDAVAGKIWLHETNKQIVNFANFRRNLNTLQRRDQISTDKCDVIMALKLMTPAAYNIDYLPDDHGEDIGWSRNATSRGLILGYNGEAISKHCMNPKMLETIDPRVGW